MGRNIAIFVFTVLLSFNSLGQYGSFGVTDARSLGMGNTYNATTFDLYAIGKNPGLLANKGGDHQVSLIFPNFTAQHYGLTDAMSSYDYYTTNKLRSDGLISLDKEKFRIALENDGFMFIDMLLGFFSVAFHPNERLGSFAFTMSDYMTGFMRIPSIILDVHLGDEIPGGNFSADNFNFKAWWIRNYALSYSRYIYRDGSVYQSGPGLIKNISVGITTKYTLTYAYTDLGASANLNYSTATQTLTGSYNANARFAFSPDLSIADAFHQGNNNPPPGFMRLEPAGKGFGFDLGAGAELRKGWTLGFAITDIGGIKWEGYSAETDLEGYIDISGAIDNVTLDSLRSQISIDREVSSNFNTPMPTALRLGVSLKFEEMFHRFPGELLMGFDYNQGLNNQPSNYTASRFSMGFHYRFKPKWPILIGGYTYDLLDIGRGSIGIGYDTWFVDVYVSTIDIFSYFSAGDRFSASLVARWKLFTGRQKNKVPECY